MGLMYDVIIIGGGQAAASVVQKFRALNKDQTILIISEEAHPPYQRPPLSKKYLAGELALERLYLRPLEWYQDNNVDLRLSCKVEVLDRTRKTITLHSLEKLQYGKLVFATGARPRQLPKSVTQDADNVYSIRSIQDIEDILPEFQKGRKLVVIGGGYIGLEAASIARLFEVDVTLIEAAPRILGRVAAKATADLIKALHLDNRVRILEGAAVDEFEVTNGRVVAAKLADGETEALDFMIVGIGIHPNQEIAEAAGLKVDEGILVDEYCRTNDQNIYAAGDCTRFQYKNTQIRIESVGNAIDQGEVVGSNLAGQATIYEPKPWFWSDQYEASLQIAGLNLNYDDVVVRGDPKGDAASVWYYEGDQLIAVDALNDSRAYMIAKRIIEAGKTLPKEAAADPSVDLKPFMKG